MTLTEMMTTFRKSTQNEMHGAGWDLCEWLTERWQEDRQDWIQVSLMGLLTGTVPQEAFEKL